MSAKEDLLEAAASRAQAWNGLRGELAGLKDDLASRPLGQRLRERLIDEMVEAIDGAGTVVRDTAPALIATLVILAGWVLREPIVALASRILENRPTGWFGKPAKRKFGGLW